MKLFSDVVKAACDVFSIGQRELISDSRMPHVIRARKALYVILRDQRRWSYARIGRHLRRDHSSVCKGIKRTRVLMVKDPTYRAQIELLAEIIAGDGCNA